VSPRKPKNPSRVFLAKFFGRPWREIERELRRRAPIETIGVEVPAPPLEATLPATEEEQ
jgi:hypothetical protein